MAVHLEMAALSGLAGQGEGLGAGEKVGGAVLKVLFGCKTIAKMPFSTLFKYNSLCFIFS